MTLPKQLAAEKLKAITDVVDREFPDHGDALMVLMIAAYQLAKRHGLSFELAYRLTVGTAPFEGN